MKIFFFIRSLDIGGSQRQLTMLARGLAQRGHEVVVAVLYSGYAMERTLNESEIRIISLEKRGRWDVAGPLLRLRRHFTQERPDIVYSFLSTQTTLTALLLPPSLPTRLVFGIRAGAMELDRYDRLSSLMYKLEAWLSWRADLVIVNARALRSDAVARGLPPDRIAVVPNGIDTQAMRPDPTGGRDMRRAWGLDDSHFVIGMVARLDPMKDHSTFLAAASAFASAHPSARFVCVGDGAPGYRAEMEALARSNGVEDRVIWVGEASATSAVYSAFDICTLSSSFGEGFPNVVGESMACGTPVVATDVGDVALIVGEHGEVVPPGRGDLLSAGWGRMRERIARDGAALQADIRTRIVEQYDLKTSVERTEQVLTVLCSGRTMAGVAAHQP